MVRKSHSKITSYKLQDTYFNCRGFNISKVKHISEHYETV